jgi:hypothetical protein
MNFCEVKHAYTGEPCGKIATAKINGVWYCEFHADIVEREMRSIGAGNQQEEDSLDELDELL